jgi:hypothetical protein
MCENKGIFSDLILWDNFVSNLLYPAILGSLIYDIVKKIGDFDLNLNFDPDKCIQVIFLLITVVFYVIDYFYMHFAFKLFEFDEVKKSDVKIIKVTRTQCLISFVFKIFKSEEVKKNIVETKKVTRTRCMIWLDVLDTLSFAAIIILISNHKYVFILVPILLIFLVEKFYIKNSVNKKCCIISIVIWVSILILLSFFFYNCTCCNCCNSYLLVIYGLIVFIYATKANSVYKEEKSNLKNE